MTVIAYQDLPLAERDAEWDAAAAERRVREWAEVDAEPNERYRYAFVWYDDDHPQRFSSYRLLVADVRAGELTAVPRAVLAAARDVHRDDHGPLPHGEEVQVKAHLGSYCARMGITPPWDIAAARALGVGAGTA